MQRLPEFPQDAVFQYMSSNREGDWRGFRVMGDGRLLRTSRQGQWEEDTPLDQARFDAVMAAVAAADLPAGATRFGSPPVPDDATGWALHARRQDGVAELGGLGCRPASIDALIAEIAPRLTPPSP